MWHSKAKLVLLFKPEQNVLTTASPPRVTLTPSCVCLLQSKGEHDRGPHGQRLQRSDLLQRAKIRREGRLHLAVPQRRHPGVPLRPGKGARYHQVSLLRRTERENGILIRRHANVRLTRVSVCAIQEFEKTAAERVEHHQPGALQPQRGDHGEQEGPCPRGGAGKEGPTGELLLVAVVLG